MRRLVAAWSVALLLLAVGGCASSLTDETAITVARTRDSTVRTSEKLAEVTERIPRALDETTAGVARITSASSSAIVEVAHLAASIERTTLSLGALLDEARADARETREERQRILGDVSAITSSLNAILARVEGQSRVWEDRSRDLADQEGRAAKAIAQMTEASARLSDSAARVGARIEPDLTQASRSVAAILGDVSRLTERLVATPPVTSHWEMLVGAAFGAAIVAAFVGLRIAFARAVDRAVKERLAGPQV